MIRVVWSILPAVEITTPAEIFSTCTIIRIPIYIYDPMRATVLGEYGGIGLVMKDHLWMPDRNWGYVKFNNPEEVTTEYIKYAEHLLQLIPRGFSAGVYTQITDVEGEVTGLMTYDRKEIKVNEKKIREMNQKICNSLK